MSVSSNQTLTLTYHNYRQPNIRRTFPGADRNRAAVEEHDQEDVVVPMRGKHLRVGGKQLGSLQAPVDVDSNDDEDSEEESDEEPQQYVARGGKHLRPSSAGGKYLRP